MFLLDKASSVSFRALVQVQDTASENRFNTFEGPDGVVKPVGHRTAIAVAVRDGGQRRRWSKLRE